MKKRYLLILITGVLLFTLIILNPAYTKGIFAQLSKPDNNLNSSELSNTESPSPSTINDTVEKQKFLADIGQVYDFVKTKYYKELEEDSLLEGVLQGLMSNLGDPYSTYITPKKADSYRENIQGTFGGLGIFIDEGLDEESGLHYIKVIAPIESTPAYYVGMRAGDLILAVDEQNTAQMSAADAVKIMRGEPGTKVTLTVKRRKRVFNVNITRAIIKTVDLRHDYIDEDIAYIRILRFNQNTPDAFEKAIKKFDKESYKTLIVDLRDNPGGALQAVLQTINLIFNEGKIMVGTESRILSERREFTTTKLQIVPNNKKIIVMINGGSASASEIFAGAIKDHKRGTLVGEKTFGKGLVQSVTPYKKGYITMTISQYYTPARTFINTIGIDPDIEITNNDPELNPVDMIHASEMQDDDLITKYIEEIKGKLTENSVEEFQKRLEDQNIPIENKAFLQKLLYSQRARYENIISPYSLETDNVLSQTIEKIRNGEL